MPHFSKRFSIKPEVLANLYWEKGLALPKIGKCLGLASRTVNIRMKECGIPLRKPGVLGPNVARIELKKLYIKKRMSSRKIAKIYKCAYSTIDRKIREFGFPIQTLAAAHIFTHRANFSGSIEEKAYLIGFSIGDLRVRKIYKNSETIHIDCGSTKPEQISLIKRLFKKYGKVWISKPKTNGKIQIEVSVNQSFSFLLPKYSLFPIWAMKRQKIFLNILAGFIDAEGCFFLSKDKSRATFSLGNYNRLLLEQINLKLKGDGFSTRLFLGVKKGYRGKDGYAHRQDYWILSIQRKSDIYRFANLVMPFLKHNDRIRCAKKVLKNIDYRNKKFGFKGKGMLNFTHDR